MLDQATGNQKGNDNTVGISLSYGSQSSKSNPDQHAGHRKRQQPHRRE